MNQGERPSWPGRFRSRQHGASSRARAWLGLEQADRADFTMSRLDVAALSVRLASSTPPFGPTFGGTWGCPTLTIFAVFSSSGISRTSSFPCWTDRLAFVMRSSPS